MTRLHVHDKKEAARNLGNGLEKCQEVINVWKEVSLTMEAGLILDIQVVRLSTNRDPTTTMHTHRLHRL